MPAMPLSSPFNWRTFLAVYVLCMSFVWGAALGATGGSMSWNMFTLYWQPRVVYAADYYAPQASLTKTLPALANWPQDVQFQVRGLLAR